MISMKQIASLEKSVHDLQDIKREITNLIDLVKEEDERDENNFDLLNQLENNDLWLDLLKTEIVKKMHKNHDIISRLYEIYERL